MAQSPLPDGTGISLENIRAFFENSSWWGSRQQFVSCDLVRGAGLGTSTRGDNLSAWNFNNDGDDLGWTIPLPATTDTTVDLVFDVWIVALSGNQQHVADWEIKELIDASDIDVQANLSTGSISVAAGSGGTGTMHMRTITITAATLATLTFPTVLVGNMDRNALSTGNFGVAAVTAKYNENP